MIGSLFPPQPRAAGVARMSGKQGGDHEIIRREEIRR
jgi:hypothetical protein